MDNIFCKIGIHSWYYGYFQTGKMSNFTGDHVGVNGRSCLDCNINQIKKNKKYVAVKSFNHEDIN